MPDHGYFANLIRQIADVLRGPNRSPPLGDITLIEVTFSEQTTGEWSDELRNAGPP